MLWFAIQSAELVMFDVGAVAAVLAVASRSSFKIKLFGLAIVGVI